MVRRLRVAGFTLIELLVVVSIIALLMAILVPALSQAKDIAMCIVCLSNERQGALANFMYAEDYPNTYTPFDWWHTYSSRKYNKSIYISYAYNVCSNTSTYQSKYSLFPHFGFPYTRKLEEIERAAITLMFVDGSFPRDTSARAPSSNIGLPVGAFHTRGKAANLVTCDGHAVTFKDFLEYDEPYEVAAGGEIGKLEFSRQI